MSKSPMPVESPFSANFASIPIRFDNSDEPERRTQNRHSEHICQKCSAHPSSQPIHCIQVASYTPAPPPYDAVGFTPSNNLAVPRLNLSTSRSASRPRPPRPALRFEEPLRPHVRFRGSITSPLSPCTTINDIDSNIRARTSGSSIPNTPDDDFSYKRPQQLGLGIPEAPFNPDPSPIRSPGLEKLAEAEKGRYQKRRSAMPSPNLALRIEEKLVEYSHSGNPAKSWLLEIISWFLSALCMMAIVVTLFILNGKPVPDKLRFGLTLNAYISILSRIASAALLLPVSEALGQLKWSWFQGNSKKMWDFEIFDNASRGPWGSFLLLVRTKGTTLAALGAAITIFAMALDPFFQQIVHSRNVWEIQPNQSSLPILTRYDPGFNPSFTAGIPNRNPDKAFLSMADDYFQGYGTQQIQVGNTTRPDIPILCPTGNCTWEPYMTLGVCDACTDIADMLEFACVQGPLDWVETASAWFPYQNGTMCGWFFNATSDKPMLMSGYIIDPITNTTGEILMARSLPLITNINRRSIFGGSINFKDIRNSLTDFVVVSPADGPEDEKMLDSIFQHQRPRAYECMLSMCVKTMISSYEKSSYTETVTERFLNNTPGPYPWTQLMVGPDLAQYLYAENITIEVPTGMDHLQSASYTVSNETAANLVYAFDDYLPSFGTREKNTSTTKMRYRTYNENSTVQNYDKNPWTYPHNVTEHIGRLATSLTNEIRLSSTENVKGSTSQEQALVEVRWVWLSLPIGLLTLTFIFLVATIVRSSKEKDNVGVWKNSAIANIIYGLPDRYQAKLLASQANGTPRTKAKMLNVRMLPTKDWRISGNVFSSPIPHSTGPDGLLSEKPANLLKAESPPEDYRPEPPPKEAKFQRAPTWI